MKIICLTILRFLRQSCDVNAQVVWNMFATYLLLVCQVFSFFSERAMPLCQVLQRSSDCLVQRHKFWLHEDVVWRTIRLTDCCLWDLCIECRSDLVTVIAVWHWHAVTVNLWLWLNKFYFFLLILSSICYLAYWSLVVVAFTATTTPLQQYIWLTSRA